MWFDSGCVVYDDTVCDVDVDCHGEDGAHGLLRCIMDAVVVGADALVVDAHAARTRVPLRMVLLMLRRMRTLMLPISMTHCWLRGCC